MTKLKVAGNISCNLLYFREYKGFTPYRHCEVRSNRELYRATTYIGDCFVPCNDDNCFDRPMSIILNISIILLTIATMEALSWAMHKYLFHGPLWFIHKTHHGHGKHKWFELNDLFSILFAGLSLWLMWAGHLTLDYRLWIGAGISLYGIIYFIFHDWFIHNRFKPFKTNNSYLLNIRRAHKIHHKSMQKWPSEEFGLLVASKRYGKK